ncbi:hypothetical protein ACQKHV_08635, partial [Staphylococcus hominis]
SFTVRFNIFFIFIISCYNCCLLRLIVVMLLCSAIHPEDYEKLMITTLNVKRHYYLAQHVDKYIDKNIRAVIEMIMK